MLGLPTLLLLSAVAVASSNDPSAQDYQGPKLPHGRLIFSDAFGGQTVVDVEVASAPKTRERGLMWRTSLRDGEGMIFLFPDQREHSFWMKNTLIPLDMVFFDEKWRIVGILEGVPPENLDPRSVNRPSQAVLEVPSGWCARAGVRGDSKVRTEGL